MKRAKRETAEGDAPSGKGGPRGTAARNIVAGDRAEMTPLVYDAPRSLAKGGAPGGEATAVVNRDGTILSISDVLAEALGKPVQSLVTTSLFALATAESKEGLNRLLSPDGDNNEVDLSFKCDNDRVLQFNVKATQFQMNEQSSISLSVQLVSHKEGEPSDKPLDVLAESSSDFIVVIDGSARVKYANPSFRQVFGYSEEEVVKINVLDLLHPDDLERASAALIVNASTRGIRAKNSYRARTSSGQWRIIESVTTNRMDDPRVSGIVVNARDVTDRDNLARALATLSKCNQVMMHALDENSLLNAMCQAIVDTGGYALACVGYAVHDELQSVDIVASAGDRGFLQGSFLRWGDDEYSQGPTGSAIRTGRTQVVEDVLNAHQFLLWREKARTSGLRSVCSFPLKLRGKTIGALAIYSKEPGTFDEEAVALLLELANDVSYGIERVRNQQTLTQSEERFRTLSSIAPIGIMEISEGEVCFANAQVAEIFGTDIGSIVGRRSMELLRSSYAPAVLTEEPPIERKGPAGHSYKIMRPDGEHRHVRVSVVYTSNEAPVSCIAAISDVTAEVRAQEALIHQAYHDPLTDLANRVLFLDRLELQLAQRRNADPNIAVLFLDLDRFKIVNDSLGHEAGDIVLVELAKRFSSTVRAGETVARFSGDEFVFIVKDVQNFQDAVGVAQRILSELSHPILYQGTELIMTASIGVVLPEGKADARTVVRDADIAMYHAKLGGGDRYELFDEELYHRMVARLTIEGQLRQALALDEFELYYQPKVDPATGMPVGAEGLVRWNHPTRGLVLPLEFIGIAEESGLIKPMGNWVFREAIQQLAKWDAMDDGPRLQILSVNVSASQLEDPAISEIARDEIQRFDIAPQRVAIEVTESTLMATSAATKKSLFELESLGVKIGIDDFGTGYSSLAYLHTLPVSVVKVDRTFIERLGSADDSTPIVKAIIEMSHAMGLGVVAEGVGDAWTSERIQPMGFDLAQGFHWAPPMPADEFVTWWASQIASLTTLPLSG